MSAAAQQIPLSRVIAALSFALDLTEGELPGHAARTCKIGMRVAQEAGLDAGARSDLFYALLLKDAGCSANSAKMAALFGADDHAAKRTSKRVDWSGRLPALLWSLRTVAPGGTLRARAPAAGDQGRGRGDARADGGALRPRRADRADARLEPETAEAIRALDEHWDGGGQPRGLRGEEIPPLGRILASRRPPRSSTRPAVWSAALAVVRRRAGRWFDPALVAAFGGFRADTAFWASLADLDVAGGSPRTVCSRPTRPGWT